MGNETRQIIDIENVLHPGKVYRVDAEKYAAMKKAFLKILPAKAPGLAAGEIIKKVKPHLPAALFPGGATAGWWVAAVQLDLEAKNVIKRADGRPVRLYRVTKRGRQRLVRIMSLVASKGFAETQRTSCLRKSMKTSGSLLQ